MYRYFLLVFLSFILLDARENPFFPVEGQKDIPYTSNSIKPIPKLDKVSLKFPPSSRVIKKVTIEYENLDASLAKKSIVINKIIDWHKPLIITQDNKVKLVKNGRKVKQMHKKVFAYRYLTFFRYGRIIKIKTKDKLIRNFLLARPHRIVLDFKRDTNLKSYIKNFDSDIIKKIKIGNHEGYYRVVIELDGPYVYKLKRTTNSYTITLN